MIYSTKITVTKNTTENSPLHTQIPIKKGVINQWNVYFPSGSRNTTAFRVRKGGIYILPFNASESVKGDNIHFIFPEFIFIGNPPYTLDVDAWNEDLVNDHFFTLYISIVPAFTLYPFSSQMIDLAREEEVI